MLPGGTVGSLYTVCLLRCCGQARVQPESLVLAALYGTSRGKSGGLNVPSGYTNMKLLYQL